MLSTTVDLSLLAILHEINDREFKRKLTLFPEELRFYAILAAGIIGLENSRRTEGMPEPVIGDAEGFVGKLLGMIDPRQDSAFRTVLETYFAETLKDELRNSCANCRNFGRCLDIVNLSVGELFQRRVEGEETESLKGEIRAQVEEALRKTPHVWSEEADRLCAEFVHQYSPSNLGTLFGRYSEIAAALRESFGIDIRRLVQEMVSLNLSFCEGAASSQQGTA